MQRKISGIPAEMDTKASILIGYWGGFRGLGERVKLVAEYLHVPYIFKTYNLHTPEEWATDKPTLKTDFPNLPYLIDGDKVLTESEALIRYLILKSGRQDLLGTNTMQIVEYAVLDGVYADIFKEVVELCGYGDPNFDEKFTTKVLTKMQGVDRRINGRKWCVGDDLTFIDFKLSEIYELITAVKPEAAAKLPNLKELNKKFLSIPEIAAYKASERAAKLHFPAGMVHIGV